MFNVLGSRGRLWVAQIVCVCYPDSLYQVFGLSLRGYGDYLNEWFVTSERGISAIPTAHLAYRLQRYHISESVLSAYSALSVQSAESALI